MRFGFHARGAGGKLSAPVRQAEICSARFGDGNGKYKNEKYKNEEDHNENVVSADQRIDHWHCQRMYIG